MPYKFNPITGKMDYYEPAEAAAVTEDTIQFLDNFDDNSVFWAWWQLAKNGSISESGDVCTLSVANGVDGYWDNGANHCPRLVIGAPGCPFIFEVKINSYTVNDFTMAGLFISSYVDANAGSYTFMFGRTKDSNQPIDGLASYFNNAYPTSNAVTTLPIYLRMKVDIFCLQGNAHTEYSTDGETWSTFDSFTIQNLNPGGWEGLAIGFFAKNVNPNYNAISAPFDYFRMFRSFGPTA